jgi:putative flavoprotein involved in K+ transport
MPILFFVARHLLTVKTPIGRKMRPDVRAHGGPLLRVKKADLARIGVEWTPDRTTGVRDGKPVVGDGRVLDVANVIWCTGFRQDFDWIKIPMLDEQGWPDEERGVVTRSPGLYFCGLSFQSGFTSMLIGGAGLDAEYVARHIDTRSGSAARRVDEPAPA